MTCHVVSCRLVGWWKKVPKVCRGWVGHVGHVGRGGNGRGDGPEDGMRWGGGKVSDRCELVGYRGSLSKKKKKQNKSQKKSWISYLN